MRRKLTIFLMFIIISSLLMSCDRTLDQGEYNYTDRIFAIVALFFSSFGIILSIISIILSKKHNTSQLIRNAIMEIYDDNMWETYKKFEMQEEKQDFEWYDITFYDEKENTSNSKAIDRLFGHFNYICYLLNNKLYNKKEKSLCTYYLDRILESKSTKNYLYNLYHFTNATLNCKNVDECKKTFLAYSNSNELDIRKLKKTNQKYPYYYLLKYAIDNFFIDLKQFMIYESNDNGTYSLVLKEHLKNIEGVIDNEK